MLVNNCNGTNSWFSSISGLLIFKKESRDHGLKGEFLSHAKPIVFGTAGKRVLCMLTFSYNRNCSNLTPGGLKPFNLLILPGFYGS